MGLVTWSGYTRIMSLEQMTQLIASPATPALLERKRRLCRDAALAGNLPQAR